MKAHCYIFLTFLTLCVSSCGNIDKIEDKNRNRIKSLENEEIVKILIYECDSNKNEGLKGAFYVFMLFTQAIQPRKHQ
jgi:hypothetical protein